MTTCTPERRKENARRASRARWDNATPEQRSQQGTWQRDIPAAELSARNRIRSIGKLSPAERTARAKLAAAARWEKVRQAS